MVLNNRCLSLFSPRAISEKQHRGLLVQFILFELLEAYKACCQRGNGELVLSLHPKHFPYDWSATTGFLNKAQEHSVLLKEAFLDVPRLVKNYEKVFVKELTSLAKRKKKTHEYVVQSLKKIITALEPLLEIGKNNENLIHFLLKNKEAIDALMNSGYLREFLSRIHPCELEALGEKLCDQYHQRGFFSQIPEFKILLTELAHG